MTKKTEQEYEQEFDRLYSEGKVGERVLDDDLPTFRDNWIAEQMNQDELVETFKKKEIDEAIKNHNAIMSVINGAIK